MFTIHVIDNGLIKIAGHHYHHALGMLAGVKELGLNLQIYAMQSPDLPKEVQSIALPHFKKFLYRPNPHQDIEEHSSYFAEELVALRPNFKPHDTVLFSNANYDEIAAIPKFIDSTKYPGRIVLRLMFYPHGNAQQYFELLEKILKYPQVEIVVSSLPYAHWLMEHKIPNRYIPGMPHQLPYELIDQVPEAYHFAYLGQAATVKGFDHLVNALLLLAKRGIFPKTLLHARGVPIPEQIRATLSQCRFIDEEISDKRFYQDLVSSRCLVTFYDVNNYRYSDSGIVTEAIAFNKYLIASELPFIAPTFGAPFATMTTVREWSAEALANKMLEILRTSEKSDIQFNASLKAKLLCAPTIFMKNTLDL